ncbi:pentapeptide repeat-containing protein [Actinomycetospora sp. CA-101289]|uniref:pentapeptide repeat-containing protein n=1 Tax=Actinomycetospora sp. CA-101289 TaxID=3239893 RepID=UPI003D99080D
MAQLGEPAVDVRIGGIFALQRLGIDSPRDQPTVVTVLSAYVRNHLPFADSACLAIDAEARRSGFPPLLPSDVATAIDVLARRDRDDDGGAVANLAGVCLPGSIILRGRDLSRFDLGFANLDDATLDGTGFRGDSLVGAVLLRAELRGADFTTANVDRSYLSGARNVDLSGAVGTPSAPPGGS